MPRTFQFASSALAAVLVVVPGFLAQPAQAHYETEAGPVARAQRPITQIIVKFRDETAASHRVTMAQARVTTLSQRAGMRLGYKRAMSGLAHVMTLPQALPPAEARALAKRLELDANVEYAEPDSWEYPLLVPNDPQYAARNWHYWAPGSGAQQAPGGANLPTAWDTSRGQGVVAAVIDTGIVNHPELNAQGMSGVAGNPVFAPGGNVLPGYDFITDPVTANDGDGRDADASDPGDWNLVDECGAGSAASPSSWHGSHVAGTIAAITNNNADIAGVAYEAKVLPVRALGKCGGLSSDIADAMRWAAGLTVSGVPANPNRARVINMSLGSDNVCSNTFQQAVNDVRAAGTVIVAATGNSGSQTIGRPANCAGVIAVTSHTYGGDRSSFASVGPGIATSTNAVTLSGPGGGSCFTSGTATWSCVTPSTAPPINRFVWSTMLFGATTPTSPLSATDARVGPTIVGYTGTSMATPHVAGVAALLLALNPSLTPDGVASIVANSARAFPASTYCAQTTNAGVCGTGMLDAAAAIARLSNPGPAVSVLVPAGILPSSATINMSASAATVTGGVTAVTWQWRQVAGPTVTLVNPAQAAVSFQPPPVGGTLRFEVRATDTSSVTSIALVTVRVAVANVAPTMNPVVAQSVVAGNVLTFTVSANDPNGDALTYSASGLPTGSTFSAAGVFSWPTTAATAAGNYSVTVIASDGQASSAPLVVPITVSAAPVAPPPSSGSSGGGGGGALGLWQLLWLTLLLPARVVRQRGRSR